MGVQFPKEFEITHAGYRFLYRQSEEASDKYYIVTFWKVA